MNVFVGRPVSGGCVVLILLSVLACSDGQEPIQPGTIAIQSGNNQNGPTGSPLPQPLQVLVSGTDGLPFSNATVQWAVTSGTATVSPATSSTDNAGVASTMLTLGATIGAVVVTATVSGITPVSFTATIIDACAASVPYTIGSTVEGTLSTTDCRLPDGSFTDQYSFTLAAAQGIRFSQTSTAFNSVVGILDVAERPIAFNDDVSDTEQNASLVIYLAAGPYVLSPGGLAATDLGAYTVTSAVVTEEPVGCGLFSFSTWAVRGVQLTHALTDSDCVLQDADNNDYFTDSYFIVLPANTTITIRQNSTAVNSYLELYQVTTTQFVPVAVNDDAATGSNDARIEFTVQQAGIYMILPSSSAPQEIGAYTLIID